jgi:flagellar biosynthetic protein FliQ
MAVDFSAIVADALRLSLWLAAPALGACLLAALLTSLLQAATQASDPALGFVPRWLAVLLALFLSRAFLSQELLGFSTRIMGEMARLGR